MYALNYDIYIPLYSYFSGLEDEFNDVKLFGKISVAFVQGRIALHKFGQFFLAIASESEFGEIHRFVGQQVDGGGDKFTAFSDAFDGDIVFQGVFQIDVQWFIGHRTEGNVRVSLHQREHNGGFGSVGKGEVDSAIGKLTARNFQNARF